MKNSDYELASEAIKAFQAGTYPNLNAACEALGVDSKLAVIMLSNEHIVDEDIFVDETVRASRIATCNDCEHNSAQEPKTCMICACPIAVITNMKFKECPIGKW